MQIYSEYSFWWIIPILIFSYLTTYFFYRRTDWLANSSSWVKRILFSLRFFTLTFIFSLLLGIILESTSFITEKPVLITLVDNSASMKNYNDSNSISNSINQFNNLLNSNFSGKYEIENYTIGEEFSKNKKIALKENQSNLQLGFESIASQFYNRNIGAVIFISDGNFNKGINPVYSAKNIPLAPIFTIGIGDTIPKKDQAIKNVFYNEFTFLRTKSPVEITIESTKLQGEKSKINLFHKGKLIASKQVTYNKKDTYNQQVTFEIEANEIGFQEFYITLSSLNNEYTYKNNSYRFYIDVLDNRNKILLLSGAPHPDLTALKSILEKDENVQVKISNSTQWKDEFNSSDLVIWYEPGVEFSKETLDKLTTLKKPIFYFIGSNTPASVINQLNLGFSTTQNRQTEEVQAEVADNISVFDMPSNIVKEIGLFPPVFVKYGNLNLIKESDVLLYQKVGSIRKNDPLLFFGKRNQGNYGVFYGEGIWKWKFYEYSKTKNTKVVDQLFQKVFSYLLVKQNKSSLQITLPKKFTTKDEILLKAEFYNPSLELITKPEIKFELINQKNKKSVYQFGVTSNFYTLTLGSLPAGKYLWKASCIYGGKNHRKQGEFIVDNELIEQLDTKANHIVLLQIAQNSNGKFFHLKNSSNLFKTIENRDDIVKVSYEQKSTHDLRDYIEILILILGLLAIEWFIRRWFGGY